MKAVMLWLKSHLHHLMERPHAVVEAREVDARINADIERRSRMLRKLSATVNVMAEDNSLRERERGRN